MSYRHSSATGARAHFLRRMARRAVRCAGCGSRYRLDRMRLLANRDGAWLYLARCTRCRSLSFIGVVVRDARPVLCDATARELEDFASRPPVSQDEVLNMRALLARFDGDFAELFQKDRGAG